MTPHIGAKKGEIAKIVLMAGDPLRAKYICENFLDKGFKLVSDIRGMLVFTGKYQGYDVTIMGHGMGIPSIGIYSYELFHFYDVNTIIRIGSCGSFLKEIKLGDLIIASKSISDSNYAFNMKVEINNQTIACSKKIHDLVIDVCNCNHQKYLDGLVLSSDAFYGETNGDLIDGLIKANKIYAVEMEAFALYVNATKLNKNALTLLTVSDSIVNDEQMDADARRTSFKSMMEIALKTVVKWYETHQ